MKLALKLAASVALCAGIFAAVHAYQESREEAEERLEQDGMEQAMHQRFLMTRDPALNDVPTGRLVQAMAQREALLRNSRVNAINWSERGPLNVGGRTRAAFFDSRDATGNTVFSASVSGGIWKTTNFLTSSPTWTAVDEKMANLAVTCMWQSKNNPLIMYAGTGEGFYNIDAIKGGGVFKSVDGGITWTMLPSTFDFDYCQDIVMDNNNNVYVSLRNLLSDKRGIHRSSDGGATWTQVAGLPLVSLPYATGRAADLEVASNGDLYATLGVFTRTMVIKSAASNGAAIGTEATWVDITPPFSSATHRAELAVSPSNPQRVYVIANDSASAQVMEFMRSDNGGATWASLPAPAGVNNGAVSQNWYNMTLAIDPANPDVVVAGGYFITRTTDGGNNWTTISTNAVHVDQHLLIYQSSSRLLAGNDGGMYISNNAGAATPTWSNRNNNYNVTQFYGADFHPTQTDYFLAGAQDNNTHLFSLPGLNPGNPVVGGDGGVPHIDQTNGTLQIAAYVANNYYRSLNGGSNFSPLTSTNNNNGQFINPSDLDDAGKSLYAGEAAGKYYVITNLLNATPTRFINTISAMGAREVTAVRVDNNASNTVFLGCSYGNLKPQILKISNANTGTPTVVQNSTITASVNNATISSIDVDPNNAQHMIVTLSNYGVVSVFESTNGGSSWVSVEGNLPDMPVYWATFLPNTVTPIDGAGAGTGGGVIIGTDLGIWYTTTLSGGTTVWTPYANFPNVPVWQIKYRASDRMVLAATHGRGLWTGNLPLVQTGVSNITATRDFVRYISSMNNRLTIVPGSLNLRRMNVEVYDSRGALVYRDSRAYQTTQIPIDRFARGVYTVRISGDKGEVFVQQIVR